MTTTINIKEQNKNKKLDEFDFNNKHKNKIEMYKKKLAETTEPRLKEALKDCIKQLREDN